MNIFYSLTKFSILLFVLMSVNLVFAGTTGKVKGHIFDKQTGEAQERTAWHSIKVFGKHAENCLDSLSKGKKVRVEGRIQYGSYTDRQGIKRYTADIVADDVTEA